MSDNKVKVIQIEFEEVRPPVQKENKVKGWVTYGIRNDFPNYLLDMFERSAKHGAIIQGKADFVIGQGFAFKKEGATIDDPEFALVKTANRKGESLKKVLAKAALDYEIFEACYLEIIYDKAGRVAEIYHLPFSKVRASQDEQTFYFAEDWHKETSDGKLYQNSNVNPEPIPAFNPTQTKGKQVLYIKGYSPNGKTYPKPNYFSCLQYVQVDINISDYHLSVTENGMFASKWISFNDGVPEEEEQEKIEEKVNKKFGGSKKGGKIMISFQKDKDGAPTIQDISGGEEDKRFDLLNRTVQQEVFSGHRVTSPMIFGVKTEGQLGGRTELREAFELFDNTYINRRRETLEEYINAVLAINKVSPVYLQKSEPIGFEFSEATIARVLSDDEIREKAGWKPKAQTTPTTPAPVPGKPSFSSTLDDEKDFAIFSQFGKKRDIFDIIESKKVLYTDTFSFYKDYFDTVTEITDKAKSILDLLNKDPKTTPEVIAEVLKSNIKEVNAIIDDLKRSKLIETSEDKVGEDTIVVRTPTAKGKDLIGGGSGGTETTNVKVMYAYEGPVDDKNRPFCKKMLELDHLFSREEIESISSRVGYSVWDRRGGWYKPAGSSEARPYCRHYWTANTVIERTKK